MQRRVFLSLVAIASLGSDPTAAQATDGPVTRFDDDLISHLEGQWLLTRSIRGTQVRNRVTASWILNHQFLELHMRDVAQPPKYEAIVLIGYIHSDQRYIAHWTDTYGGKFSAVGRGVRTGNSIEFKFEYPDGPFFNTFVWTPEHRQWVFRMESVGADGERRPFATDTLVREQ
jgi:hypothetical protein